MHEFVLTYEKQRAAQASLLPIFLAISLLSCIHLVLRGPGDHFVDHTIGWIFIGIFVGLTPAFWTFSKYRKAHYNEVRQLLQVLEREHSDELPYLQRKKEEAEIEKHLSSVKKLEEELRGAHL